MLHRVPPCIWAMSYFLLQYYYDDHRQLVESTHVVMQPLDWSRLQCTAKWTSQSFESYMTWSTRPTRLPMMTTAAA
jgi:hypothetical protein